MEIKKKLHIYDKPQTCPFPRTNAKRQAGGCFADGRAGGSFAVRGKKNVILNLSF